MRTYDPGNCCIVCIAYEPRHCTICHARENREVKENATQP